MYDIDIENKASIGHLWWHHYSLQICFKQTKTYIFWVLWLLTVEFGIWGHILLLTLHGSSDDDVINLKAMIERYTFSSILYVLWPVALKLGILGPLVLLMTNNYKFVSKQNTSIDCVMMTSSLSKICSIETYLAFGDNFCWWFSTLHHK